MFRFYDFKSPWSYKNRNKLIFELKRNFSTSKKKKREKNKILILFDKNKDKNKIKFKKPFDINDIIEVYLKKKKRKILIWNYLILKT